jgi:hypothetical protein
MNSGRFHYLVGDSSSAVTRSLSCSKSSILV